MTIRKATSKDIPEIVKLNLALFKEDGGTRDRYVNTKWPSREGADHFKKLINDKQNTFCLVVVDQNDIVGYLIGYLKKVESWRPVERTEIESMYIVPQFRNQRIGQKLVNQFFEWSKRKRAIRFYKNNGFQPFQVSLEVETTKEQE